MQRAAMALLVAAGAGCVGVPDERDQGTAPASGAALPAGTRPFTIWFEPPRSGPGEVLVVHESGHRYRGPAGATGATVPLPDGPCAVTLTVGDAAHDLALNVRPGARAFVWKIDRRR